MLVLASSAACTGQVSTIDDDPPVRSAGSGGRARGDTSSGGTSAGRGVDARDAGAEGGRSNTPVASDAGSTGGTVALGGASGASGGSTGSLPERMYCDAVAEVFVPRCGGGSCHSNSTATIGDFAVGTAEAESFVDVPSVRNAACGLIIDSQNPSDSLILRKLIGDFPVPMCGGPMPVSGGDLTDAQIDCVADWVQKFRR